MDSNGLAIEFCEEKTNYIKIKDLENKKLQVGSKCEDQTTIDYIIELNNSIKKVAESNFGILHYEKEFDSVYVQTDKSYVIKFNRNLSISEQLARFEFLLKQDNIKEKINSIQYFDLRMGDKVYVK